MAREIDIFDGKYAAGLQLTVKPLQGQLWLAEVGEDEADVDEIKLFPCQRIDCDIIDPKIYISYPQFLCFVLRNQNLRGIKVNTRHGAFGHHAAQRNGNVTAAAANVKASCIGRKLETVKECTCGRPHDPTENAQPFPTFHSSPGVM